MKKYFKLLLLPLLAMGMLSSCDDIPSPYYVLNPEDAEKIELTGDGTYDNPYTVKDALAIINAGDYTGDKVYVKGVVTRVDEIGGSYGNATYFISDEDAIDEDGAATYHLEVYRGFGINSDKFIDEQDLPKGANVVVYGVLTLYGSTPEITQGSYLVVLNDIDIGPQKSDEEPSGSGTYDDPYNVAAAQQVIKNGPPSTNVYVHGYVSKINEIGGSYGNATYFISDDGSPAGQLEVYRGLGLDEAKFKGEEDLKVGDEVTVYGVLVLYGGHTPEFTQGNYLVQLNDQKVPEPNNNPGVPSGDGTLENPYNPAAANALAESLAAGAKSDKVYIKGKVSSIKENYDGGHGNGTFYISENGRKGGDEFYIYRAKYFGNTDWEQGPVPNVGDEVVIYGRVTKYTGSGSNATLETQQYESYLYSLNGDNGGFTPRPEGEPKGSGTLEDPYNAVAANKLCENLGSGQQTEAVYIKGKVSNIKENYDGGHGNGTFWISDDGTGYDQFYIFRAKYLNNQTWSADLGPVVKVGDEVIIYGKLTNYQGNTPETVQNEAYLYSMSEAELKPTEGNGEGTYDSPYDVMAAQSLYTIANGKAVKAYVRGFVVGYVDGNKMDESTVKLAAKGNAMPSKAQTEVLIADNPQETDWTKCYPIKLPSSGDWRQLLDIYATQGAILGRQLIIYGSIEKYFGVAGLMDPEYAESPSSQEGETQIVIGNRPDAKKRILRIR